MKKKIKKNKMQPSTAANKILKRFSATNPDFRPTTRVEAGCTVPP